MQPTRPWRPSGGDSRPPGGLCAWCGRSGGCLSTGWCLVMVWMPKGRPTRALSADLIPERLPGRSRRATLYRGLFRGGRGHFSRLALDKYNYVG